MGWLLWGGFFCYCPILAHPIASHRIPSHPIPPHPIDSTRLNPSPSFLQRTGSTRLLWGVFFCYCPILTYPILSYPIQSHPIPFHPIPSHPIPSYPIPSHPIDSTRLIPSRLPSKYGLDSAPLFFSSFFFFVFHLINKRSFHQP